MNTKDSQLKAICKNNENAIFRICKDNCGYKCLWYKFCWCQMYACVWCNSLPHIWLNTRKTNKTLSVLTRMSYVKTRLQSNALLGNQHQLYKNSSTTLYSELIIDVTTHIGRLCDLELRYYVLKPFCIGRTI